MNGIPLGKAVIGVGVAGLLLFGATLAGRREPSTFDTLTKPENDILAASPELHAAAERLHAYTVLDGPLVDAIVVECVQLAHLSSKPATHRSARNVDNSIRNITSRMGRLRKRVQGQSANNAQVLKEFDEVSDSLGGVCESQSFNMHQRISSF